jgi:hypothetical protein
MGRHIAVVLYLVAMAAVIVGVDFVFFRNRFWERLTVNIGIVLVFAAFYLRFLRRPSMKRRDSALPCDLCRRTSPRYRRVICGFVLESPGSARLPPLPLRCESDQFQPKEITKHFGWLHASAAPYQPRSRGCLPRLTMRSRSESRSGGVS